PICYAVINGDQPAIVSVLDEKPKSVPDTELARVRNIRRDPRISLIVDHYDEDWSQLAFVQIRGNAHILEPDDDGHAAAIEALRAKYRQYRSMAIELRQVILIDDLYGTSWGLD
ncbi:MAG: pyridoxamine 5'-phosphate oxidase family protein, partial [Chloroflexota bacterium]|nr:pyridoxamine 5'-phosphate oxidase family protein [Chloroflexota bacterium]